MPWAKSLRGDFRFSGESIIYMRKSKGLFIEFSFAEWSLTMTYRIITELKVKKSSYVTGDFLLGFLKWAEKKWYFNWVTEKWTLAGTFWSYDYVM